MIIGRDFFKAHNMVVDHANDSMVVDSVVISLNMMHSISTTLMNEYNEFIDTNEPYEPIDKQLISLQKQIDLLKVHKIEEAQIAAIQSTIAATKLIETNLLEVDKNSILQSGL
jgi:hypothetical protein